MKTLMPGPELTPRHANCQQECNHIRFFFISLHNLLAECLPPGFYLIKLILNTTVRLFCLKHCLVIALSRMDSGFLLSDV